VVASLAAGLILRGFLASYHIILLVHEPFYEQLGEAERAMQPKKRQSRVEIMRGVLRRIFRFDVTLDDFAGPS
jgi:hypothetical protein